MDFASEVVKDIQASVWDSCLMCSIFLGRFLTKGLAIVITDKNFFL